MATKDELVTLCNHYRKALYNIRHDAIPFTREWRLANDALQEQPTTPLQLEMEFKTDDEA